MYVNYNHFQLVYIQDTMSYDILRLAKIQSTDVRHAYYRQIPSSLEEAMKWGSEQTGSAPDR